jgi:hypothetical protein
LDFGFWILDWGGFLAACRPVFTAHFFSFWTLSFDADPYSGSQNYATKAEGAQTRNLL